MGGDREGEGERDKGRYRESEKEMWREREREREKEKFVNPDSQTSSPGPVGQRRRLTDRQNVKECGEKEEFHIPSFENSGPYNTTIENGHNQSWSI